MQEWKVQESCTFMQPGGQGQIGGLLPQNETMGWVAKRQKLPEWNPDLRWDSASLDTGYRSREKAGSSEIKVSWGFTGITLAEKLYP